MTAEMKGQRSKVTVEIPFILARIKHLIMRLAFIDCSMKSNERAGCESLGTRLVELTGISEEERETKTTLHHEREQSC